MTTQTQVDTTPRLLRRCRATAASKTIDPAPEPPWRDGSAALLLTLMLILAIFSEHYRALRLNRTRRASASETDSRKIY